MTIQTILSRITIAALLMLSVNAYAEKVILHTVMDVQRNIPMFQIPLPADWKITTPTTPDDPSIVGPNGIKIYYRSGGSYAFSNDPYMQQNYAQSGQAMRAPINALQLVEQDLQPQLSQHGLTLIRSYPLPDIAQRSQVYNGKLFKSVPTQQHFDAAGSEWSDGKGNTMLVIVDQIISTVQGAVYWHYLINALEAPDKHFAEAKDAFIYGLVNTQDNPQQIQAFNLSEQRKTNQSWQQHNARMQQRQQNFERQQAIHKSTSDAVNRSINSTYQNQNASSDRLQDKTINVIRDESTVTNPHDGEQYQVDSGSDQYWINNQGEYIPSDDPTYNPNLDPNSNQDWQQAEPQY